MIEESKHFYEKHGKGYAENVAYASIEWAEFGGIEGARYVLGAGIVDGKLGVYMKDNQTGEFKPWDGIPIDVN